MFIYDALSEQLPVRIPPGGSLTLSVTCAPADLGVYKLCLVLSFSSFTLQRLLTARCVPTDAALRRVLAPSAPYVATAARQASQNATPLPETKPADRGRRSRMVTGRRPWPRPCLGDHPAQPAAAVAPALAGGHRSLRPRTYGRYQHALLHTEEAAVNASAHTATGVKLTHLEGQDLFQIIVPGVAALHPGILIGDRMVVTLCGIAKTPDNVRRLSPTVRCGLKGAHGGRWPPGSVGPVRYGGGHRSHGSGSKKTTLTLSLTLTTGFHVLGLWLCLCAFHYIVSFARSSLARYCTCSRAPHREEPTLTASSMTSTLKRRWWPPASPPPSTPAGPPA